MMGFVWMAALIVAALSAAGLGAAFFARRQGLAPSAPAPLLAGGRRCPHCQATIDAQEVICPVCQLDLRTNCPHCGEVVDVAARRCPACRGELPSPLTSTPPGG